MTEQLERRSGLDRRSLSGAQRVAALLIVMGRDAASRLLKHFEADDVREITRAAATLGLVDSRSLEILIQQFALDVAEGPRVIGDFAQAEELASSSLPPTEVSSILADLNGSQRVDAWAELKDGPEARVIKLIAGETAQIAAVIVSRLDPPSAARVCEALPADFRVEVLSRMLATRPLTPAMAGKVEDAIRVVLPGTTVNEQGAGAASRVANIVNRMESAGVADLLESLESRRPAESRAVRALVFKFEDVSILTLPARATIFDQIPTERVILALHGADEAVRAAVMGCLGARARRMVEAELAREQSATARDVAAARRLIADTALQLAESGVIELPGAARADDAGGGLLR